MFDEIRKHFFSVLGLAITLGVIGFLSGIVGLFIDVNGLISIKWLLGTLLILLSVCMILLNVISSVWQTRELATNEESPIRFLTQERIFVIRRNENFTNNTLVGCYLVKDEVELPILLGVVHRIQGAIIQIKVLKELVDASSISSVNLQLKDIIIKPGIPIDVFPGLGQ